MADAAKFDFEAQRVTRLHLPPETHVVDASEEGQLATVRLVAEDRYRADLRQCLDNQHAGHDRVVRKVPLEEVFVDRDVFDADCAGAVLDRLDGIDEQERIAVWDDGLNGGHVKHGHAWVSSQQRHSAALNGGTDEATTLNATGTMPPAECLSMVHAETIAVSNQPSIAIIGAGAWGTTLAALQHERGCSVTLVTQRREHADAIRADGENRRYLAGVPVSADIAVTTDLEHVRKADVVLLVVPTAATPLMAATLLPLLSSDSAIVACSKGLIPGSAQRVSEVLDVAGFAPEQVAVLSGPNLAREIAAGLPASAVVASRTAATAKRVQAAIGCQRFRIYTSTDMVGVEFGGALKNVIAIAAGVVDGMALGHNAKAAIIARGLAEMLRVGVAAGADALTFAGLSGLGDLVATCESPLSRNRSFGERLAQGMDVGESLAATTHVVEGVATAPVMRALGQQLGVQTPIADAVCRVIAGEVSVQGALQALLQRESRPEPDRNSSNAA